MSESSVRNNWLLLALVSAVSFGGALLYLMVGDENSPVFLIYFAVTAAVVAGVALWWYGRRPPRRSGPAAAYIGLIVLMLAGGVVLGMVPGTRAIASWLTIGVVFTLFGLLQRSAVIAGAGVVTGLTAVAVYLLEPARLGLILELATGVVFAVAAVLIRRDPAGSDTAGPAPRVGRSDAEGRHHD